VPAPIVSAAGSELWDETGKHFVDFTSQSGTAMAGHAHPELTAALLQQFGQLPVLHRRYDYATQITFRGRSLPVSREAARAAVRAILQPLGPYPDVMFHVSGASALVMALKAAKLSCLHRQAPPALRDEVLQGRQQFPPFAVLAYRRVYHGHTGDAQLLTDGRPSFRFGATPGLEVVRLEPPPRQPTAAQRAAYLSQAHAVIRGARERYGWRLLGLVAEPVLGNGYAPDPDIQRQLVAAIRACGGLFIADEIKTGLGRVGRMFASELVEVVPDIVVLSKGIAAGRPAAVVALSDSVGLGAPTEHVDWESGTFVAEPLAIAGIIATLELARTDDFPRCAERLGERLHDRLARELSGLPGLRCIRGPGALVGLEFSEQHGRDRFAEHCLAEGVLTFPSGTSDWTTPLVLLMPPLTTPLAVLDLGLDRMAEAAHRLQQTTEA
jgi:4-aminobutyrate aminotransferase-like enzyme